MKRAAPLCLFSDIPLQFLRMFIMVDGVDGSGKSTVIGAWREMLTEKNQRLFDLKDFCKKNGRLPLPKDGADADVIFSGEPTSVWIGGAVREEMIKTGANYSASAIATAFSLDRLVLYSRFLNPLRASGKLIIQDRGVSSSIAYQPIQSPDIDLDFVLSLEGNQFALEHKPDVLLICQVTPETAIQRLSGRTDKKDNAIFERAEFLAKLAARYESDWFRELFEARGTKVMVFNGETDLVTMKKEARDKLQELLEM
ncbi:MAG: thymidylate kinase [Candidatus Magasanikbacteria bacterium]|nr:thymidylate kinase [Candidatus Magasanikbacteria bacterium]